MEGHASQLLLLDANSLFLLARSRDEELKAKVAKRSSTLGGLAFFELGNAIWKESELLKSLTREEADSLASDIGVVLSRIEGIQIDQEHLLGILEIARREKITFYDSAYIYTARMKNLVLITEDEKLSKVATKYVKVKSISSV